MQRCIECLCDTPDGAPSKCAQCQKKDREFGAYASNVEFFHGSAPRKGTTGVYGDHDAYHGSSDPADG